ncbi:MAG: rane protein-like protein [Bacteroidota bacterium]|nr:rane protein-like protein [Bacteroidota bacterium]
MALKVPKTVEEIRAIIKPIRNINIEQKQQLSNLDKLAVWITDKVGSMGFFLLIFVWTVCWLVWNSLGPTAARFDPYPAFVLWLFISNMIQIFLMPLIMIGQNLQSDHAEARAEADFEVNCKAELEIETILLHLENQNKMMIQILEHLQKNSDDKKANDAPK